MNRASAAVTRWHVPQLGGAGARTALHLVNTSTHAATVTLRAYGAGGTAAATNVQVKLAVGQQYSKAISEIFGIDPNTTGSLQVDSDTGGVFGDVLALDSGFAQSFEISLPLTSQTVSSLVLPLVTSKTTAYVFNPNATKAASVTVTPYADDGSADTGSRVTVPALGLGLLLFT